MICNDRACGCAISTTTLSISGSGTPDDPWVIEQEEFTDITTLQAAVANIQAVLESLPGAYVAKAGDEMSGLLHILTSGGGLRLTRTGSDAPFLEFMRESTSRIGYIQANDPNSALQIVGESGIGIRFYTDGSSMRAMIIPSSGILALPKTATNIATTGVELQPAGSIWSTRDIVGFNFASNKTSVADVNGAEHFRVQSAGTTIGTITRATASTTGYNTSSDEDLKQNIVEIDDQLALYWMRTVQPMLFEYIISPGVVQGGYIAQRVAAAWPESVALGIVTPGFGNIADRTWDPEGNETTPEGVWRSWQIDLSKFVPFIHAGLQAVDVRVSVLEGLVIDHALELASLRADVTMLQQQVAALSS